MNRRTNLHHSMFLNLHNALADGHCDEYFGKGVYTDVDEYERSEMYECPYCNGTGIKKDHIDEIKNSFVQGRIT